MGVDAVWTEDSGEESLCQGDYAVTLESIYTYKQLSEKSLSSEEDTRSVLAARILRRKASI